MDWKKEAVKLWFNDKLNIVKISQMVGRSRQTVAALLKNCDGYEEEILRRKIEASEKRKRDKAAWDRKNRVIAGNPDLIYEAVRQEHRQAVAELSRERYH